MHNFFVLNTFSDTKNLANQIANELKPGDNFGLVGDLGSGKTTFIQMVMEALGVKSTILSPTYTIINSYEYKPKIAIYHADLYRLDKIQDIEATGIIDFVEDKKAICFIEWSNKAGHLLENKLNLLEFEIEGDQRIVKYTKK